MSELLRLASLRCWLVIDDDGCEAVFVDQARAEQYAAERHGVLVEMVPARVPARCAGASNREHCAVGQNSPLASGTG